MKKTILTIVMAMLCIKLAVAQNTILKTKVTDKKGKALSGVTIAIKGSSIKIKTDQEGTFILKSIRNGQILILSHLGYKTKEVRYDQISDILTLESEDNELEEVNIVSTGYQTLPKERATGSFAQIDQKTLNRSVGINIIDRLDGVSSGLSFNRNLPSLSNNAKIAVHGRSTLFANAEPLIVLNGFPYEGTIDQINPADIENITILKDAAAASIWGTRSGNGVIVINTKTGRKNQPVTVNASSTLSIAGKPDLYYTPRLSSADFIDLEQYLFSKGFYNSRFSNPYNAVSAAVEIFNQRKNNRINAADSATQINALKGHDVRSDLERYFYRNEIQQQYQLNFSGGSEYHNYYLSGGYDKNLENKVSDDFSRLTFNANNTISLLKDRITISADVSVSSTDTSNPSTYTPYSPYERIADEFGNSLPVVFATGFRMSYVDTAGKGKLLDWHYRPKDELSASTREQLNQYRVKTGLNFKIMDGMELSAYYQYLKEDAQRATDNDPGRYSTRNLINQYSSISENMVNRVIPIGNILSERNADLNSKIFRTQLNYHKTIAKNHELTAIAGYEGSDGRSGIRTQTYYGYDPETQSNANASINPLNNYKFYFGSGSGKVNTAPGSSGQINISQSFYSNVSYIYKGRYILSGSARRDESNIFGVKTNQKGVPLWSAGLAWNISQEGFYKADWLPSLKLRATYGYNGNVDKTVSAYLTAFYIGPNDINGDPYSVIRNPPNPALRWEKVRTWNLGLDFSLKNDRISGSIDAYQKNATDLIGNNPIAPQTGVQQFKGNGANLQTRGIDLILNSRNLTGILQWSSNLLVNYNTDKVSNYKVKQSSNLSIVNSNFDNPLEGHPYYAIFSFPSAGLDATGAPQGYLDGAVSKDYAKITGKLDPGQLTYHGSATPKYSGSLINTFTYRQLELSVNLSYKLGYYFRRANVFGGSNYGTASATVFERADYEKRWQKPGDELQTIIPALVYPANFAQYSFFQYSSDLVERGDHIRLQDVRLSYFLTERTIRPNLFKKASVFIYARNLGILWRSNKLNIDPDYGNTIPQPISGSIGINLTF